MKKLAVKMLAAITALVICLPLYAIWAGDGLHTALEPAAGPAAAAVQEVAVTAEQTPVVFKVDEELPAAVTAALAEAAAQGVIRTAGNPLPGLKTAGIFDEDPVTLVEFGSELLGGYLNGMNNFSSRLVDTGGEFPEFIFEYDDNAGNHQIIYMGMYYDEANQLIIGRNQQGAFTIGFDVDLKQKMLYAAFNGWNRKVGFNRVYDLLAPAAGVFYDTQRIKFEYGGQDWMVQLWKGLYFFVGSGAEIGIYNKPQSRTLEHYDCAGDDDLMEMSIRVLRDEKVLLERAPQKHWWMNGFVLSTGLHSPDALTFEGSLRFEDEGMKAAFLVAFEELSAREGITFTVDGGLVSFVW